MERSTIDFWVGLFVIAGGLGLVFLAMKVGNLTFSGGSETYSLEARFSNIGGLKPRAPVKSAGVVVGRVSEVSYDNTRGEAVVKMRLQKEYQFDRDTYAHIYTSGLLGEQYIGLKPGGDSEMLKGGDRIRQTQSAVVLEELIGQFLTGKADSPQK